jgi:hypothetical protein
MPQTVCQDLWAGFQTQEAPLIVFQDDIRRHWREMTVLQAERKKDVQ